MGFYRIYGGCGSAKAWCLSCVVSDESWEWRLALIDMDAAQYRPVNSLASVPEKQICRTLPRPVVRIVLAARVVLACR